MPLSTMFNQTLKNSNVSFKLFLCVLLFRCYSTAPVNSSVTYSSFLEEIVKDGCSFPAEVSLPFSSKDTFEYLARPLQICKAPEADKRTKEAILLCTEIFDTLKNITCHSQTTQLPKIEVVFSEDVCKDIKIMTFPNTTESLLKHLNDTIVCEMMCDAEFQPACTVLLWSYKVQKQIEDAQKLEENKEAEKPVKNEVPSENRPVEETNQIKVTLTNGKSEQDDKHVDSPKMISPKEENYKQIELDADSGLPALPNVEITELPSKIKDDNLKNQKNINSEGLLISNKKQNQSAPEQNYQEEEKKMVAITKENIKSEDGEKSISNGNIEKNGNKSIEVSVQGILSNNNELAQTIDNKIVTETKESYTAKNEKSDINKVKVEPKKEITPLNIDNHLSLTQFDENKKKEPTKLNFPKNEKINVQSKETNDQIVAETQEQNLKKMTKQTEAKVVTSPEMSSLPPEKPLNQPEPTPTKKAESPKNAQDIETGLDELHPLTTIADLEKMEEGNEIPESSNKDQDSYNGIENEGEFSKVDYDGDDGFFEPPKSKQPDESVPAKLPDSIIESQNELSKYPVFPARNSIGQSNDIQVIPAFPEQEDSHFFFYFLSIVIILMAGYLLFHNKQKIIALIVEGRHERRRRSHGVGYKKLDTK